MTWRYSKSTLFGLSVILIILVFSTQVRATNGFPSRPMKTLARKNNFFAFNLYSKLKEESQHNLLFSPYSIANVLTMTASGAYGETLGEISTALHRPDIKSSHRSFQEFENHIRYMRERKNIQLYTAIGLYLNKGFSLQSAFKSILNGNHKVNFGHIDFANASPQEIDPVNQWISEATENKITKIMDHKNIDPLTRFILLNAVYFKANWKRPFDSLETRERPFHLPNNHQINVPIMHQKQYLGYYSDEETQILELPYTERMLSMIIILPRNKDNLIQLENNLTVSKLHNWSSRLKFNREISVFLPKFTFATGPIELKNSLQKMGIIKAFDGEQSDFSGLSLQENVYINSIIHQVQMEVNEQGTEASAATYVPIHALRVGIEEPIIFNADHPFLYLIRDNKSGMILLMGRLSDPSH